MVCIGRIGLSLREIKKPWSNYYYSRLFLFTNLMFQEQLNIERSQGSLLWHLKLSRNGKYYNILAILFWYSANCSVVRSFCSLVSKFFVSDSEIDLFGLAFSIVSLLYWYAISKSFISVKAVSDKPYLTWFFFNLPFKPCSIWCFL